MAHSLYITYSGGSLSLNSGNIRMLEQYVPRMGNGETTVDSVELEFSGTAVSQIHDSIQAINRAMGDAVKYTKDGIGTRCFAYFQPDGYTGDSWRSELVPENSKDWKLDIANDAMSKARWNDALRVKGVLAWKRADWWEQETAGRVNGYNNNGTLGNDLILYGCDDGSTVDGSYISNNWVHIPASEITGDLPSPALYSFNFGSADNPRALVVGSNPYGIQPHWESHIEAEGGTVALGSTKVASSYASGGTIVSVPIPPGVDTEVLRWTGSSDLFDTFNRQFANVFLVFGGTVTSDWIESTKYSLVLSAKDETDVYWRSDFVHVENDTIGPIQKLTTVDLPPKFIELSASADPSYDTFYAIRVYARQDTAGTITPYFDCLQFMPATYHRTYYLNNQNKFLTDYGDRGGIYSSPSQANYTIKAPVNKVVGDGIYLVPGEEQRIYFLPSGTASYADLHKQSKLTFLNYRPRRRLI